MTRPIAATAAGAGVAVLVTTGSLLAWSEGSPLHPRNGGVPGGDAAPVFLGVLVAAYAAYLGGLALVRAHPRVTAAIVVALVIQLGPLAGPLLLSTDAWTYWGYGWLAAEGESPYDVPPQAHPDNPALPVMGADWRDTTSVYGPAFTLASEPVARIADDDPAVAAFVYRALAALAVISATLLAARLSSRPALAAAFVGWNPLLAIHAAGGGHNDAWVGALMLAALALEASRRTVAGGFAWTLATFVKWIPLPLLVLHLLSPATSRRKRLATSIAVSTAVSVAVATARYGTGWLGAAAPLASNALRETSFAFPARLEQLGVPHGVALAFAGAAFALGFAWLARDALRGRARLAAAACLVLVTTPYLTVWYLGWTVPLAAADDDDRLARGCCLALGAYLLPQTIPL